MKVSVQMTLRMEPGEYEKLKDAAERAGLSVPMWLIRAGLAAAAREAGS